MADGTTKIVLNAIETMDDVSGRLKEFLRYVAGESSSDEYIQKLDDAVKKARANKEWRAANVQRTFSLQPTGAERRPRVRIPRSDFFEEWNCLLLSYDGKPIECVI